VRGRLQAQREGGEVARDGDDGNQGGRRRQLHPGARIVFVVGPGVAVAHRLREPVQPRDGVKRAGHTERGGVVRHAPGRDARHDAPDGVVGQRQQALRAGRGDDEPVQHGQPGRERVQGVF